MVVAVSSNYCSTNKATQQTPNANASCQGPVQYIGPVESSERPRASSFGELYVGKGIVLSETTIQII